MKSLGERGEMGAASGSKTGFDQRVENDMARNTLLEIRPSLSVEQTSSNLLRTAVTDH